MDLSGEFPLSLLPCPLLLRNFHCLHLLLFHVQVCVHALVSCCARMRVEVKGQSWLLFFLGCCAPCLMRQGLSLDWSLLLRLGSVVGEGEPYMRQCVRLLKVPAQTLSPSLSLLCSLHEDDAQSALPSPGLPEDSMMVRTSDGSDWHLDCLRGKQYY